MDIFPILDGYEVQPDLVARGQFLFSQINELNVVPPPWSPEQQATRALAEQLGRIFLEDCRRRGHPFLLENAGFYEAFMILTGAQTREEQVIRERQSAYERGLGDGAATSSGRSSLPHTGRDSSYRTFPQDLKTALDEHPGRFTLQRPLNTHQQLRDHEITDVAQHSPGDNWRISEHEPDAARSLAEPVSYGGSLLHPEPESDEHSRAELKFADHRSKRTLDELDRSRSTKALQSSQEGGDTLLSKCVEGFLMFKRSENGDDRAREDAGIILQFCIDILGDRRIRDYSLPDFEALEVAMPNIPMPKKIPRSACGSLFSRYSYAEKVGWDNLQRLTEKRLKVFQGCCNQFFRWIKKKRWTGFEVPEFSITPRYMEESKDRDAWSDEELRKFFNLPLFTGCAGRTRIWEPGEYLNQNHLYWAYNMIFFMGMRHSEIGRLRLDELVMREGLWHIDITGRNKEDVKRKSSRRCMPIPLLLIDLGLLERREECIRMLGETGPLFPEWHIYVNKSGRVMMGHTLSKSWGYIREKAGLQREGLTLYGGRHTTAGWYDEHGFSQRLRNRLLGHAPKSVADRYGPKRLTSGETQLVLSKKLDIQVEIATILLEAKAKAMDRELATLPIQFPAPRSRPD